MDSKIVNLFSFLNSNEDRYTDDILNELSTLSDFKKFKKLPKETLDILICKHGFNPDNKEIVDYLKSLGGSDDFFKDVKQWMDEMFKDLIKHEKLDRNLNFYIHKNGDIKIEENFDYNRIYIDYVNVYYPFEMHFRKIIFSYKIAMSIFHEYLTNYLNLKGEITRDGSL